MDFRGTKTARGIRNNNPGNIVKTNIKWQGKVVNGKDSRFEEFVSIEYGIRAMMRNIVTKFSKGLNSIEDLIKEWAPAFENNTAVYIQSVSRSVGIAPNVRISSLDKGLLIGLCKAIAQMENAPDDKKIPHESYEKAFEMIGYNIKNYHFDTSKKKSLNPNSKILLLAGGVSIFILGIYLISKK